MTMSFTGVRRRALSIIAAGRQQHHRRHCRALSEAVECPGISSWASAAVSVSTNRCRGFDADADAARRWPSSSSSSSFSLRRGIICPPSSSRSLHLSMDQWNNLLSRKSSRHHPLRSLSRNNYQHVNLCARYFSSSTSPPSSPTSSDLADNSSSSKTTNMNSTASCNNDGITINCSTAASSMAHSDDENNAHPVDVTHESASPTMSQHYNKQQICQSSSPEPINNNNNNNNTIQNNDNSFLYSNLLPPSLHPYARLSRLDKPIGTFLLLHPCLWSVALAFSSDSSSLVSTTVLPTVSEITPSLSPSTAIVSSSEPNVGEIANNTTSVTTDLLHHLPLLDNFLPIITPFLSLCTTFALGSFIMRSAGCTINDMWDANYDRNVERTKSRPLASGEITHLQAAQFLVVQLLAGLGVLVSLPHVEECVLWGVASLPLVVAYPLMKRYTHFPQVVLGMTFNWGAIMGWVAVRGGGMNIDWSIVGPLYVAGIAWTVVYDTLYAHQDKKDDAKLGLKSTALTFGDRWTKPILTGCTGVAWGGWMMAGYNCGFGTDVDVVALSALLEQYGTIASATTAAFAAQYAYYSGVSAAALHLLWQIHTADLQDADNLAYRFKSNNLVGWIVFGSCCVAAGGSNLTAVG